MAFICSNTRVAENRTRLVCLGVPPRHVYAACRRCLLTYSYLHATVPRSSAGPPTGVWVRVSVMATAPRRGSSEDRKLMIINRSHTIP